MEFKQVQAIFHPILSHFSADCPWYTNMEMLGNFEVMYFSTVLVTVLGQALRQNIFLSTFPIP